MNTRPQPHILIVDDEESVRFVLQRTLRHEGYLLDTATNGREAQEKLQQQRYDLMLLDLHMEPISGMEVFNTARRHDKLLQVIILTAHGSLETSVEALRLDAFDYLFKPAEPEQIRERVRAGLAHREQQIVQAQVLEQTAALRQLLNGLPQTQSVLAVQPEGLQLDHKQQAAVWNGQELELTTAEFNILEQLVRYAPEPQHPVKLVQKALGYESEDYEAREIIKWHIHQLRRKIEQDPSRPRHIKTVRYKGYLWSGDK